MRVLVRYGRAVSLRNVAEDIANVLLNNGIEAVLDRYIRPDILRKDKFTHVINVTAVDPLFTGDVAGMMQIIHRNRIARGIWYGTVEGEFRRETWQDALFVGIDFVANSNFTKEVLVKYGLNVKEVVYHGVDPNKVIRALSRAQQLQEDLRRLLPDKVIFLIVASELRRKGWQEFIEAWKLVDKEVRNNSKVLYISTSEIEKRIRREGLDKEIVKVAEMGQLSHTGVMALMAVSDYLIFPSLAEGFGLPALEAISVGTPVICGDFPPLNEFLPDVGLFIPITETKKYIERRGVPSGQVFILHLYRPEDLADKIEEAYYMKINKPDEYGELRSKLSRHARKFYTTKVYKWFVNWVRS